MSGNEACMEMLINRYKTKVFTAIQLVVNDRYIAEDIFQETFASHKNVAKGKYEETGKFLPWVIRIARNLAMDHFRSAKKMPKITSSENEDIFANMRFSEKNSEETTISKQRKDGLRELIKMLPPDQKEVLILRHYGDLSFKEIADVCDCSINTALGRMRYALINLKKMIEEKAAYLQG
ncbi:MAG: sigma-70 family RNA polymerase sigma factor [Bacteroidia bacterium]